MMDIVKRLRAYYKTDDAPQLVDEAADEIERLRVELAEEIQQYEDCREQLVSAQAREAKLREELGWLRNHHYNPFEPDNQSKSYYRVCAAFNLPSDDTALRERLRAERERCAKAFSQWDRDGRWAAGVIRAMEDEK